MEYTLKQIAKELDVEVIGDANFIVDSVASLESARNSSVVFVSDKKFLDSLERTKSKVVVTTKDYSEFCNDNIILSDDPYLIFARISSGSLFCWTSPIHSLTFSTNFLKWSSRSLT